MVGDVFGADVDLSESRVFRKKYWVFQKRGVAMAPNRNIYFHPDDHLDDFSTASIGKRAWFMHEVTHVWQHQQGINVRRAIFNRSYDYSPLESGKSFGAYSLEQQGEIVRDYYLLNQGYKATYGNHSVGEYEAILPFGQ